MVLIYIIVHYSYRLVPYLIVHYSCGTAPCLISLISLSRIKSFEKVNSSNCFSGHRLRLNSTRHSLSLCLFPGTAVSHRPLRETAWTGYLYIHTPGIFKPGILLEQSAVKETPLANRQLASVLSEIDRVLLRLLSHVNAAESNISFY